MKSIQRTIVHLALLVFSGLAFAAPDFWIDVRTADEFKTGHVAAAVNVPYDQIGSRIAQITTNKNAEIYLNCQSGRRSGIALETLRAQGYTKVKNVGGIDNALRLERQLK